MKEIIHTDQAPEAVGPYSQAIKVYGQTMVFCSMQIALDPKESRLVGAAAAEQADQCLKNLQAVLTASGAELKHVVKTIVYLTNMADFVAVNEIYGKYFTMDKPARGAVEVARLPKDAKVGIEAIAVI
ncbi:MAG TPA: reactive intermediate/imine deaminase [candidate division Zixibacteria bacterium]|nr:reactive intermediate/imine deaminase [candidate division Zixibacteria bacterium]